MRIIFYNAHIWILIKNMKSIKPLLLAQDVAKKLIFLIRKQIYGFVAANIAIHEKFC